MTTIRTCLLAIAASLISGCAVNEVITSEVKALDVADSATPESQLLDIGIVEFDAGVPKNNNSEKSGIYEVVREAEVRYLPYHLKTTLQATGHWGAVRVIPSRALAPLCR